MHRYRAFQLTIHTDIPLPELQETETQDAGDVRITYGNVSPQGIDNPLSRGLCVQANKDMLWLNVPNIARYLVIAGQRIIIDPTPGVSNDSVRLYLLGSCFGALLMQRDLLPLHGNAIQVGRYAISFTGHSGAGKSTLCAAFLKRGYTILADDICAINNKGYVIPSFPQIKLWSDATKQLGIDTTSLRKIRPNIEKFAVPLPKPFSHESLPLKIVYILHSHNQESIELKSYSGMHKMQPLKNQIYRRQYLKGLNKDRSMLTQCAALGNQITLVRVNRPNSGFALDKLVDSIEKDIASRQCENEHALA